eukprot:2407679-Prymnesium_polylepis.1
MPCASCPVPVPVPRTHASCPCPIIPMPHTQAPPCPMATCVAMPPIAPCPCPCGRFWPRLVRLAVAGRTAQRLLRGAGWHSGSNEGSDRVGGGS